MHACSAEPEVITIDAHDDDVNSVAFSTDSKSLASVGIDRFVRIWDLKTGKQRVESKLSGIPYSVAYMHNDQVLLVGEYEGEITGYDAKSLDKKFSLAPKHLSGHIRLIPFPCGDGERFIACPGPVSSLASIWTLKGQSEQVLSEHRDSGTVECCAIAPNGQDFVTGDSRGMIVGWHTDGKVKSKMKVRHTINCMSYSPDGMHLAVGNVDGVFICEATTLKRSFRIFKQPGVVRAVTFSPDNQFILGAYNEQKRKKSSIRIWDAVSGKERMTVAAHEAQIDTILFSLDGKLFASAGRDGKIIIRSSAFLTTRLLRPDDMGAERPKK